MKPFRAFLFLLLFALPVFAGQPLPTIPVPEKPAEKKNEWVFTLLPKSLQKNPNLELTVNTEMTEAGKQLPPVTPANPAYVELFTAGPQHKGDQPAGKTVAQEEIERVLTRSLASNGYLLAKPPEHPPSLVIIYTWGSHSRLEDALSPEMVARNLLDRAALVGGDKFAREMLDLFQQADAMNTAAGGTVAPDGQPVITPEVAAFINPVYLFKQRSAKNEFLVDQMASDVFYVSASAYDYRSVAENRKQLLWRTRMTVASPGVSQQQSLPTLVISAAPFLGRETPEPETLYKRSLREGSVELGTPRVVEENVQPAPAAKK